MNNPCSYWKNVSFRTYWYIDYLLRRNNTDDDPQQAAVEEYLSNVEIQMGRLFLTEASQLLDILPENVLCTFMSTSGWIRITLCFRSCVVNQVSNVAVYVVLFLLKIQPSCYLIMLFWQQWNQQKGIQKVSWFCSLCPQPSKGPLHVDKFMQNARTNEAVFKDSVLHLSTCRRMQIYKIKW